MLKHVNTSIIEGYLTHMLPGLLYKYTIYKYIFSSHVALQRQSPTGREIYTNVCYKG